MESWYLRLCLLPLYLKVVMRWLTVAANQDANQRSVAAGVWDCHVQEHANAEVLQTAAAKMTLVVSLLETKGGKWYSRVKWCSIFKYF